MPRPVCQPLDGACQQIGRANKPASLWSLLGTSLDAALKLWVCVHCVFLSTVNSRQATFCAQRWGLRADVEHHSQKGPRLASVYHQSLRVWQLAFWSSVPSLSGDGDGEALKAA